MIIRLNHRERVTGVPVAPLSRKEITARAWKLRIMFAWTDIFEAPLEFFQERMLQIDESFYMGAKSIEEMGDREGITVPCEHAIYLRDDVFDAFDRNENRARFTVAHECGHYILHSNQLNGMARKTNSRWEVYCDSEWQANAFAADFLVPPELLKRCQASCVDIASQFGVSNEVVQYQISRFFK